MPRLAGALMSTVNASEAIMRSVEKGFPLELVRSLIVSEQIELVAFDMALALTAAELRPATRQLGLSFADRACLALAIGLSQAGAATEEYVLGAGDIVRITVFQNPDLTTETRVAET